VPREQVRLLIFHGYLLSGTGSNVYTAQLAAALVRSGCEVHLFSQDRRAERREFVDAVGDWDTGALRLRTLREPVRCTVYRPDVGSLLPVYVEDRYEGVEARSFLRCSDEEIERYVEANVRRVAEVAARSRPCGALANHLVMGPLIVARALGGRVPYAVKIHGSALEFVVKADPERFVAPAREGLRTARTVLVGSAHSARSLWAALGGAGTRELRARTFLGPPGVDVELFRPLERYEARRATELRALAGALRHEAAGPTAQAERASSTFARDPLEAARALEQLASADAPTVAFVGKLLVSKGPDLLLAAWPLVLQAAPEARLVVVGFGAFRATLEGLLGALGAGDVEGAIGIATGRSSQGDAPSLEHLRAFLAGLRGEARARYSSSAAALADRVALTGRLEHDELARLLPVCEAVVTPSTFPESFGMIVAEAAACGALPISARHSGLQEVSAVLAEDLVADAAGLLSFPLEERPVQAMAERITAWLAADVALRARTRAALAQTARRRFSWEGVARGVLAAVRGDHEGLLRPVMIGGGVG
jgi:glycosyltransferase involved in cell wall biosynthesis